jgi:hypothetical protein
MNARRIILLGWLLAVSGCGGPALTPATGPGGAAPQPMGGVRVVNRHPSTVVVVAIVNGSARRLGYVDGGSSAAFSFPIDRSTDEIEITIQSLVTGEMYATEPIPRASCALIELTVAKEVGRSGIWVPES